MVAAFVLGMACVGALHYLTMSPEPERPCKGLEPQIARSAAGSGSELLAQGRIVDAEYSLVSKDRLISEFAEVPPWVQRAVDEGWRQTKLTFHVNRRESGSSPDEVLLLAYHPPEGCPGATSEVADPLFAAALDRAHLRISARELPLYPARRGWLLREWIRVDQG